VLALGYAWNVIALKGVDTLVGNTDRYMAPIGSGVTLGVEAKTYCEPDRVSATGPSHATDNSRRKLASAELFPETALNAMRSFWSLRNQFLDMASKARARL
jgi:hypothetical protein